MLKEVFIKVPERLFLFSYSAVTIRFARANFRLLLWQNNFGVQLKAKFCLPGFPGFERTKKGFAPCYMPVVRHTGAIWHMQFKRFCLKQISSH
jgi:hypothetical protein